MSRSPAPRLRNLLGIQGKGSGHVEYAHISCSHGGLGWFHGLIHYEAIRMMLGVADAR